MLLVLQNRSCTFCLALKVCIALGDFMIAFCSQEHRILAQFAYRTLSLLFNTKNNSRTSVVGYHQAIRRSKAGMKAHAFLVFRANF